MRKNKVLCKSLKTVETLGSVDIICSDKTGTLTKVGDVSYELQPSHPNNFQNQMSVTNYLLGNNARLADTAPQAASSQKGVMTLANICAVCNAGEFDASTINKPLAERHINGDATDQAILRFAEGITPVSESRKLWQRNFKIAFNSKNKFMIQVIQPVLGTLPDQLLTIKGAPDVLLPRCSTQMASDGTIQELGVENRSIIEKIKDSWSSQGKRVILVAQKPLTSTRFSSTEQPREYEKDMMEQAMTGLTLVGLVGIVDPPRKEIPEVVRTLRGAGVRIFMVTGDFKLTAQAIAAECGIITQRPENVDDVSALEPELDYPKGYTVSETSEGKLKTKSIVISGSEIPLLDDDQWDRLCAYDEIVFARTTPDHKLRIVKELQARDHTVGMTGDGVNDAPSLSK